MSDISDNLLSYLHGINPVTGEVFDPSILSNDPAISKAIIKLALLTQERISYQKPETVENANPKAPLIFQSLRSWRLDKARELGYSPSYIFTNKELIAIANSNSNCKEDLILCRGISHIRYDLFADEIWDILKDYQ